MSQRWWQDNRDAFTSMAVGFSATSAIMLALIFL